MMKQTKFWILLFAALAILGGGVFLLLRGHGQTGQTAVIRVDGEVYRRIDLRVDKMLDAGLLDEAKLVYDHRQTYRTAAQAIGYKEFFPYFEGTATLDACTEKLKQASRNYAKRQLTWFRHMDGVVWLDASAPDVTARAVQLTQEFLAKG